MNEIIEKKKGGGTKVVKISKKTVVIVESNANENDIN